MIHRLAAAVVAVAMVLALAGPAAAGGWAEIVADADTEPPIAGEPIALGFTVLQHGQTAAPWETPTVHLRNVATGDTIDVVGINDRSDGHFVATVTVPEAGYWSWQVTLRDLIAEQPAQTLAVRDHDGALPAFDPGAALGAIEQARREVTDALYTEIGRLDGALLRERERTDRLAADLRTLAAAGDPVAAQTAPAEGAAALPLAAIVTLAILAGALAGAAMAWLAGRPRVAALLRPTAREADPA